MIFSELITKINQLFGYTPTQAQLLANPDLLEIAVDACGVNVASLTDIATSLNTLLGTSYTGAQLTSRPDLIKLGLKSLGASLPNGALINGVANFYQSAKPTTRVDGSALAIGDVWKKAGQELAEWDGTNWVGALQQHQILILGTGNSTAGSGNSFYPIGNKILLKKYEITGRVEAAPANSATDYWTFSLSELTGGSPSPLSPAVSVNNQNISYTAFANLYVAASLNQIVDYSVAVNNTGNRRGFYPIWAKNGAAPNITAVSFSIQYRIIYE